MDNDLLDNYAKLIYLITKRIHEKECPYVSGLVIIGNILDKLGNEDATMVVYDCVSQVYFREQIVNAICDEYDISQHKLDLIVVKILDKFIEDSKSLDKEDPEEIQRYIDNFVDKIKKAGDSD